jgi:hypothetical protein
MVEIPNEKYFKAYFGRYRTVEILKYSLAVYFGGSREW